MTDKRPAQTAQEAAQKAAQKAREGRDWLVRYSPWSYIGVAAVGFLIIMLGGNGDDHRSAVQLWFIGYALWWLGSTVFMVLGAARGDFGRGTLSDTPARVAQGVRRQAPVWLVAYALLVVDSIIGTSLAANLLSFVVFATAAWYMLGRRENLTSAAGRLRSAEANIYNPAQVDAPQVADPYAGVTDDQPAPVQPIPTPQRVTVSAVPQVQQPADPYAGIDDQEPTK